MMPIDYVIPFVDSSDREWVGTYRKYAPTDCSKNGRISKKSGPQMLQHAFFVLLCIWRGHRVLRH